MHFPEPCTSQIFALLSKPADKIRWPCFGKNRIAWTPFACPLHVCMHRFGA